MEWSRKNIAIILVALPAACLLGALVGLMLFIGTVTYVLPHLPKDCEWIAPPCKSDT